MSFICLIDMRPVNGEIVAMSDENNIHIYASKSEIEESLKGHILEKCPRIIVDLDGEENEKRDYSF